MSTENTIYAFAQASSNEDLKTTMGDVGDQIGCELNTRKWYLHGAKWAKVYRIADAEIRELIAEFAVDGVANGNIGYGQDGRSGLHRSLDSIYSDIGYNDVNRVKTPCEVDCSSFVFEALRNAIMIKKGVDIFGGIIPWTENGTTTNYISDHHLGEKFFRSNNWLPVGMNFDYYMERVLPLLGIKVDVYVTENHGIKWKWVYDEYGWRYQIAVATDDPSYLTPYVIFGKKSFRVKKVGNTWKILEKNYRDNYIYYDSIYNFGRICESPYDFIKPSMSESLDAFFAKYVPGGYVPTASCPSAFTVAEKWEKASATGGNYGKAKIVSGATVTAPDGKTGCQVYQLVDASGNAVVDPTTRIEAQAGEEIYFAFFDPSYDTFRNNAIDAVPTTVSASGERCYYEHLKGDNKAYRALGVNLTDGQYALLQDKLKVHILTVDGTGENSLSDFITSAASLQRGDIVRTRAYNDIRTQLVYDDSGNATEEEYVATPGHIAIWV